MSLLAAGITWRLLSGGSYDRLRLAAVFLALAVVVLSLPTRWRVGAVLALVAAWFIAVIGARYVPDLINPAARRRGRGGRRRTPGDAV